MKHMSVRIMRWTRRGGLMLVRWDGTDEDRIGQLRQIKSLLPWSMNTFRTSVHEKCILENMAQNIGTQVFYNNHVRYCKSCIITF